ncbi:uncharacterized protein BDZ83DRAFT_633312 [Colletotrichum acutatum]|uniref:Uncharacterized protein n=1 Tax=Glomerella acutata TaxID=27357 RepID=A0AAD8UG60_GLOAC|nr:uncharacterized protein BDZ83DRAFT_633312 [Colletotrichum acutatum]KAK1718094.1 hypothetical protein BDZ83DRAFT_633312 [Colletotrichum acutatum]
MKAFISLIAFFSMLSLSTGLAPNYISRSPTPEPAPVPGFLDGVLDAFSNVLHGLSKAGKFVWDKLDEAEQELLESDNQLVIDGCNVVRCGVELGFTSVKCLIDVVGTKGIGQAGKKEKLGCLAEVSQSNAVPIDCYLLMWRSYQDADNLFDRSLRRSMILRAIRFAITAGMPSRTT